MEKLYTMETLAQYLGVSVRTILREKAAGCIGFKRIRGQVRFSQQDVDNYLSHNSYVQIPGVEEEMKTGTMKLLKKPSS